MFRYLLMTIILIDLLQARENPFFSAEGSKGLPVSSNRPKDFEPLKRAAINLPDSARVLKEVTVQYQNLDGSLASTSISLDHSVDWHLPIFISQTFSTDKKVLKKKVTTNKTTYKMVADLDEAVFYQAGNSMRVKTTDRLIRHFMVTRPHRVVMDFEKDANFRSRSKDISDKPYKKIRMGNHDGYYRVVIELDGQYHYEIVSQEGAHLLTCF